MLSQPTTLRKRQCHPALLAQRCVARPFRLVEKLIQSADIRYTILRAAQFFEFIGPIIAQFAADGQTVRSPSAFFQPIGATRFEDWLSHTTVKK